MADGGVISMPVGMALGGAVLGGAMDSDNPMRGAALGALGGYTGGAAVGAMGAAGSGTAAGMGGSLGGGLTAGGGLGAAGSGMGAAGMTGSLGGGLSAGGGLAGAGSGMAGAGGLLGGAGMEGAMGAGVAGSLPQMASGGAGLLGNPMAEKALSMGGQMLMKDQQAKQGQPVMPGVAPPMMRPQFAAPSFMSSAPSFRPAITGLPMSNNFAADPRRRG